MEAAGSAAATVLVVDDQRGPRESLRMILAPRYAVRMAASAGEALEILRAGGIDVATLDLTLPDARGSELMRALRSEFPELELIVISGQASFEVAADGIRCGITDYLVKPFGVAQVTSAMERALARRRQRGRPVHGGTPSNARPRAARLENLARAAEPRKAFLTGHGQRVAYYAGLLAERCGFETAERERLRFAARLHDLGKIGVRLQVLTRPGPLTPAQRREIQQHPAIGASLLEKFEIEQAVVAAVRHHHEWWDGRGYPAQLRGEAIPLSARMIQVADAFDAMVSERPYRRAQPRGHAAAELARCAGSQFDPTLVKEFLLLLESEADDGDQGLVAGALAFAELVNESAAPST